jgi:hypothetical protein
MKVLENGLIEIDLKQCLIDCNQKILIGLQEMVESYGESASDCLSLGL